MKPSIDKAKRLADALEVSLDYLVGDGNLKAFDKKTISRLQDIEQLPEEEKATAYKLLDAFLRDFKARSAYS